MVAVSVPNFIQRQITFQAGDYFNLDIVGDSFTFIEVSGDLSVTIIPEVGAQGSRESTVLQGISFSMPEGRRFRRLQFKETGGGAATLKVAIALGKITDSRSNITGDTPVKNASSPNNKLVVTHPSGERVNTALAGSDAGIAALVTALQASSALRARIHEIPSGISFAEQSDDGSEQTLVSSAANTSGVLIHRAWGHAYRTSNAVYLGYRESSTLKLICGHTDVTGTNNASNIPKEIENVLLPSGVEVVMYADNGNAFISCLYEVL